MRTLAFLLALVSASASSQWTRVHVPFTGDLRWVEFQDQSEGLIVCSGQLWHTADSGATWGKVVLPTGVDMWQLAYAGVDTVYGLGLGDPLLGRRQSPVNSFDAGRTWVIPRQSYLPEATMATIRCFSGRSYLVGEGGSLLASRDGQTYSDLQSHTDAYLFDISVSDPGIGVVVGSDGCIRRSADVNSLDAPWRPVISGTSNDLFRVDLSPVGVGLICGENGTILRSTDRGVTWETRASGSTDTLMALGISPSGIAYCCGYRGTLLESSDQGATWNRITTGTTSILWDMAVVGDVVYVVGDNGVVLKRGHQRPAPSSTRPPVNPPIRRPGLRK